jgi:probable rRNA maturation factor
MRPPARGRRPRRRAKRSRRAASVGLDILVDSPLWQAERGVRASLRRAVREAAAMAATNGGELAIVLTDDSAIRALNRDWRGKDKATNVLSFPAPSPSPSGKPAPARHPRLIGDIVIAYETAAREARAEARPFRHHLAHLAVHGFLHLLGHDHASDAEAEAMEALEIAVLARLEVPNPYLAASRRPPLKGGRKGEDA